MTPTLSAIDYQFEYFDAALRSPDWRDATVLDFGGNQGGFLRDPLCTVRHENYWSVDVSRRAIEAGARRFPRAHFVAYDRFHPLYNREGRKDVRIPPQRTFDFIIAYSVMTHLLPSEMTATVGELKAKLSPGGVLAFTFEDLGYKPVEEPSLSNYADSLRHCRRLGIEPKASRRKGSWSILADGEMFIETEAIGERGGMFLDVFYTPEAMRRFIPEAEIVPPPVYRQHCAVVRNVAQ